MASPSRADNRSPRPSLTGPPIVAAAAVAVAATPAAASVRGFRHSIGLGSVGRRTLGISFLMTTVFLWTTSNFLASYIFSDSTFSKPFFVVYVNTSAFAISLIPMSLRFLSAHGVQGTRRALAVLWRDMRHDVYTQVAAVRSRYWRIRRGGGGGSGSGGNNRTSSNRPSADQDAAAAERLLGDSSVYNDDDAAAFDLEAGAADDDDDATKPVASVSVSAPAAASASSSSSSSSSVSVSALRVAGHGSNSGGHNGHNGHNGDDDLGHHRHHHADGAPPAAERLSLRETAWLSLEFCLLWFVANYLAVACLEYTSVASATIFTSLSSMFTLVLCAVVGVEAFSLRKLLGVVASLAGVALVSSIDLAGQSDESRGRFPYKTPTEIAVGDAMALLSAAVYGVYVTVMKRRVGHEDRVDMPLFFGLVGLFNVVFLWPGFVVLHVTGIEPFAPPPSGAVWAIVVANSLSSFLSDITWAYAMLLTTPVVVTVGLSLTIPLSLVGEMIQYGQYSSGLYWVGAGIVVGSFLFINNESKDAAADDATAAAAAGCGPLDGAATAGEAFVVAGGEHEA